MRCVECGRKSEGNADAWRAYLAPEDPDDEGTQILEAVVFCPACAVREFGPLPTSHRRHRPDR